MQVNVQPKRYQSQAPKWTANKGFFPLGTITPRAFPPAANFQAGAGAGGTAGRFRAPSMQLERALRCCQRAYCSEPPMRRTISCDCAHWSPNLAARAPLHVIFQND